ncbi:MAG: penicillin-binding protein 2 [Patescibacteria group bacterium]
MGSVGKLEKYSYVREWVENSFTGGNAAGEVVGKSFNYSYAKIAAMLVFLAVFILVGRVFWLSIINGDFYSAQSERNSIRTQKVEARRGIIYDRNMKPLVRNIARFSVLAVPADLPDNKDERKSFLERLAGVIFLDDATSTIDFISLAETDLDKIKKDSLESYRSLLLADDIGYEAALRLYLAEAKFSGIAVSEGGRREYLGGVSSLSHVLGYTGKISLDDLEKIPLGYDYIGKAGLESFWEEKLRGQNGKRKIEVDALGHEKKILSNQSAVDGDNLVLSLDYDLQKKAEEILTAEMSKLKLRKGAVVIMDPASGEILSLVSLPAYDNNLFSSGIKAKDYKELIEDSDQPLFDRAIAGEYPSGSTVKMIVAAAALQEKVISEKTSVFSSGGLRVGIWFFPDWKAGGHGWTDVRKALADSVNTFFYYIGGGYENFTGLGVDRLVKYFRLFGLGDLTGIDLPNESLGFVPSKEWKEKVREEAWYIGDTYHLAIGQGDLLVTPLQVARWTAFFANGGKIIQPHLVKDVLDDNNSSVEKIVSETKSGIIDDYNVEVVRQGMRQTVTIGSAKRMLDLPVETAAKTGTAQWATNKDPHAWFTAFAPYKKPEIVVTVLVEEGIEGSQVSLTVAHDIMKYYFSKNDK